LLERDGEVGAVSAAVESARRGDGQLVVVEGDAGIGKTRLLSEARWLASGFEVLGARAGELEGDFAFGVVRQLFEGALAAAPAETRAELLSGAAALASPLFEAVPAPADSGGGETSFAILHGLYWLAANFGLRRTTLLVIDDLHWADGPSLRWLAYLARRLEGLPLLVVAASRRAEASRSPALVTEILADPLAVVIRPAALGQDSVKALAETLFGLQPDDAFADALREASGGNPLYVAAILDALAQQEIAPTADQVPRLTELAGEALARGVALRLSRLPAEAVALAHAAAILGDQTELPLAAKLADLTAAAAADAAGALLATDLLDQVNPLAFRHPVVRSAVLESMTVGERMRLHRHAAEVLLVAGAPPERAATYLTSTLPDADLFVVDVLRRAAQRSLSQGAPEAAVAYLRRALEEPPQTDQRLDLLGELGRAETENWEPEAAAAHLREALDDLDDITQRPDLALAFVHAVAPLADRAAEAVELLTQLSERSDSTSSADHYIGYLILASSYDSSLYPVSRSTWDVVNTREEPIHSGVLLGAGAIEEARRGISRERAVELARRALATPVASAWERLYGLTMAVQALMLAGEVEAAESELGTGIVDARRAGDRYSSGSCYMWRGFLRIQGGQLLAAEEDLGTPEVISFAAHATPRAYCAPFVAEVLRARGECAEADVLLSTVRIDDVPLAHRILYLGGRSRVYLDTGRLEQALTDLRTVGEIEESIGLENPAWFPWRSLAALALHRLGETDEAGELAREELELSRRWGAPHTVGVSLRALGLVEGGSMGQRLLRESVEVLAESPARLEHARALIALGAALRRANSRTEARKCLREGIDMGHQCGATALVDRGNEELAATGAHPRKIMLSGLESLTASERRVAQMAAEDVSNKEIAQALFVTVKTVEVHLSRVYRKLDIESRRQLAGALSAPAAKTALESR
jgi:DNA-binding CsgD family transcriptional regulator/tetratricopeptide (TPR) repeat protein